MENLNLILPEIFISLAIMLFLIIGVFKKRSSSLIYNLTTISLVILLAIVFNLNSISETSLFNESYKIDNLSNFMKIIMIASGIFVMLASSKYLQINKINKIEYPVLILSAILGMMVMISSNDLIVFYMGLELQSLALYVLASFNRDNLLSTESGLKYFILSALSSGLLLYGCSLIYGFSGSTNFEQIAIVSKDFNAGTIFGMVFILVGLAFKISAVPFHMWTPDVYQGSPTSVTSFFSVVPKIAGISIFIKFMYSPFQGLITEWQYILVFMSIASMILGAVAAMSQSNIKRLMAYSSIGHIGYAIAGIAAGSENGFKSTLVYISIYVVMNIGAFSCILLMKRSGKYIEDIDELSGVSKNHPLLSLGLMIILFSLAGIPPLAGFFAKFYVFMAVIESQMYTLAIIGLVTTVVSAFYYIRIIKIMYFDEPKKPFEKFTDYRIHGSILLSCILLLTFFIYPSILNEIVSSISIF